MELSGPGWISKAGEVTSTRPMLPRSNQKISYQLREYSQNVLKLGLVEDIMLIYYSEVEFEDNLAFPALSAC